MDLEVKCPKCNKGYKFKGSDKPYLSNHINLNPKVNCKCGNAYIWNKKEHTFQWSIQAN
ncbi:MAG: hypothetical protein ACD_20C00128G0004 [uncultured bacterium]|nr:MAG: hypothetical protein ACD_20C00128G0004 [uncultured bacterium]